MNGYPDSNFMSYGNVPTPRNCAGCGPAAPCNNFIGSYVPEQYLTRPCNPTFCTGYPGNDPMKSSYEKKAAMPNYQQECSKGSNCYRGLDSNMLFNGNDCTMGCDGFDDIYADLSRDVAFSDMVHSDYTNVLSSTFNQVYDVRGPVDCGSNCSSCPTHDFEGIYGRRPCDGSEAPTGASIGTRGTSCVAANKPYRTFQY